MLDNRSGGAEPTVRGGGVAECRIAGDDHGDGAVAYGGALNDRCSARLETLMRAALTRRVPLPFKSA